MASLIIRPPLREGRSVSGRTCEDVRKEAGLPTGRPGGETDWEGRRGEGSVKCLNSFKIGKGNTDSGKDVIDRVQPERPINQHHSAEPFL